MKNMNTISSREIEARRQAIKAQAKEMQVKQEKIRLAAVGGTGKPSRDALVSIGLIKPRQG